MKQLGGIYPIYKPVGPSSYEIIRQLKRVTQERRIGHAGTLDPLASGVLVIGIGREATRQLHQITNQEKEYRVTIKLGMSSLTDDEEGEKITHPVRQPITESTLKECLGRWIGSIEQIPPIYSAVKIAGQKSYQLARRGIQPKLTARRVKVKQIKLISYQWPIVTLQVITGPGVYIRALARDIGQELGVGGYVTSLERIRVGSFDLRHALTLEEFRKLYHQTTTEQ